MNIIKSFADERHLKLINISHLDYISLSNILQKTMEKPNILLVLEHDICTDFINRCFNDIDANNVEYCNNLIRVFYKYDYLYVNRNIITIQKLNKWFKNITDDIQKVVCDVCYENYDNLYNCPTCLASYCKCCLLKSFKLFKCKKCSFCKEPLKIDIYSHIKHI